ncbi:putative N-carbamoylsarcosine amidase [Roridomyces roridus]|uniref:N-carbamoylsarcosine amidase n=1 Tax=Roridomyces roridus TaxID=1738132 RepID=A0AAD7B2N1_9AGAR|nr:putative N-carbamoylsarcosine amidase [Roridomyces roridus]
MANHHPDAACYARSGFSNKMGWGTRPALLIVDACIAYWTPDSPLDTSGYPASAASPAAMKRLLDAARAGSVPIIWTRVEYEHEDMRDASVFWLKAKSLAIFQRSDKRGLGGWVVDAGLTPIDGEHIVTKQQPSAFFRTDVDQRLRDLGVDTLVICGASTSGCVRASTLDAMQYGYRPMLVGEACAERSPEIQNANLFDLGSKYADIVATEEVGRWLGKLGTL